MTALAPGMHAVPPGHVAAVVTYLEMRARPRPRPIPDSSLRLRRWAEPDPAKYRLLFERVGTPWLWFSRVEMDDAALRAVIGNPAVEVYAVLGVRGIEVGLLELDFRTPGEANLAFLGLIPELAGKGHGGWLMAQALGLAWRPGIERVTVNTCTLDHPAALDFYRKAGFVPVARAVEIHPDPRISGSIAADAAPQVPLISA